MIQEVTIRNEYVQATISAQAAEVISFKKIDTNVEMIWSRNPEYWYNCNPILFPHTGTPRNNQYEWNGQVYHTKVNHGFCRVSQFKFTRIEDNLVELTLRDNEETFEVYPFHFTLKVLYQLSGQKLLIDYTIKNHSYEDMPFEIGFHPGFNVPLEPEFSYEDYEIQFEHAEDLNQRGMGFTDRFKLAGNLERGSFFFHNHQITSKWAQLTDGRNTIRVSNDGFATLGFWRKDPTTPFICIEPWYPDSDLPKAHTFADDHENNILPAGEVYCCGYYFEIIG